MRAVGCEGMGLLLANTFQTRNKAPLHFFFAVTSVSVSLLVCHLLNAERKIAVLFNEAFIHKTKKLIALSTCIPGSLSNALEFFGELRICNYGECSLLGKKGRHDISHIRQ